MQIYDLTPNEIVLVARAKAEETSIKIFDCLSESKIYKKSKEISWYDVYKKDTDCWNRLIKPLIPISLKILENAIKSIGIALH